MPERARSGRLGMMQGRLVPPEGGRFQSFPRARWRDEFPLASAAGLDAIEWIYDAFGADVNPLAHDAGIAEIRALSARHGVAVVSLCADYFMDVPIVHASEDGLAILVARLQWLIERCERAGIARVVLPFVDASKIETVEHEDRVVSVLEAALPAAAQAGLEIHLETALDPAGFARLLARVPHPSLFVNYDAGNSASLGYTPAQELAAYGERIGSVHVKDRVLGGGTVPLGSGSADLATLFSGLRRLGYAGDYVLQAARGNAGDELSLAMKNVRVVRDLIERSAVATVRR